MIRRRRIECDGCGERHQFEDYEPGRDLREYLEQRARSSGWLVRDDWHYCRTCRHAVERDSLVASAVSRLARHAAKDDEFATRPVSPGLSAGAD